MKKFSERNSKLPEELKSMCKKFEWVSYNSEMTATVVNIREKNRLRLLSKGINKGNRKKSNRIYGIARGKDEFIPRRA